MFRMNPEIREKDGTEAKDTTQVRDGAAKGMVAKPTASVNVEMNTNPYYQTQEKVAQLRGQIAIDAKLLQAQTQFGVV